VLFITGDISLKLLIYLISQQKFDVKICYNKYGSLGPAGESTHLLRSHHQPPFFYDNGRHFCSCIFAHGLNPKYVYLWLKMKQSQIFY